MAARQLAAAGSPEQVAKGIEIAATAKKELYQLLAES